MKKITVLTLALSCLLPICKAQTAASLVCNEGSVENCMTILRLSARDKAGIEIYAKSGEQMELNKSKWNPSDDDLGFCDIALWDGENVLSLKNDGTARVGRTAHGNYAEIISRGIPYMGSLVDISVRVDVVDRCRDAIVSATCLSGQKVRFVTGIKVGDGAQTATGKGWMSVWGKVGAGMRYDMSVFPDREKAEGMIRLISAPVAEVRTKVVSGSEKESLLCDFRSLTRYVKGMNAPAMTERLGGEIDNIAYSRLDDGCPINTMEHFEKAIQSGAFTRLKTDLQITKDGEIVLCHDKGFTLDKRGRIARFDRKNTRGNNLIINEMTLAEVKALEHGEYHKEMGHYGHIATLEEFFRLCKKHKIPMYTTLRNYCQEETMQRYAQLMKKYKVESLIMMNNFVADGKTLEIVRKYFPTMPYSFTIDSGATPLSKKLIDKMAADGHCIISIGINDADATPDEVWDYAREKGILIYGHFVNTREQYLHGIEKGMAGFQISKKACLNL